MTRGLRATLRLAIISAAARTPAFLIPIIIAAVFGAGRSTDAYFLAYSAVLFVGGTLGQGLEQAIVPFAAKEITLRHGAARAYFDQAARGALAVAAVCWVIGVSIVSVAVSVTMRHEVLIYAAAFTPLTLLWSMAAVYSGALLSQWKIGTSTGSMAWRGLGALLGLSVVPLGGGLSAVAIGLGIGELSRCLWLRGQLWAGVPMAFSDGAAPLRPLAVAASAQATAGAIIAAAPVVERLLATSVGIGAVSHLEYGMRLLAVPGVLFEGAVVPMLLARWTQEIAQERHPTRTEVLRAVGKGFALASAIGVGLAAAAPQLVHLVLAHGRFATSDEAAVAILLRLLAVAFVANMTAQMLERHYIAMTRNRLLAALSVGRTAIRILIAWSLLTGLGLKAFAIGFAVSDCLYLVALLWLLPSPNLTTNLVRRT